MAFLIPVSLSFNRLYLSYTKVSVKIRKWGEQKLNLIIDPKASGLSKVLKDYQAPVSILTKSDLILRDLDLLKQFKKIDVNFTINTLDEKWKKLTEPNSSSIKERFKAIEKLVNSGIKVSIMMGPYWPVFTKPEALFKEFKR